VQVYHRALTYLRDQPVTGWTRRSSAVIYSRLGLNAQDRGQLVEAEEWYHKSLAVDQALGHRPGVARSYGALGTIAKDRGRPEEAEDWYRKSLAICKELGNRPGMARIYHSIGSIAQDRRAVRAPPRTAS
jgi:tetratricopeptide (TPR) repeat protein